MPLRQKARSRRPRLSTGCAGRAGLLRRRRQIAPSAVGLRPYPAGAIAQRAAAESAQQHRTDASDSDSKMEQGLQQETAKGTWPQCDLRETSREGAFMECHHAALALSTVRAAPPNHDPFAAGGKSSALSLTVASRGCAWFDHALCGCYYQGAGWSSPVARWAHNPKVAGSNPAPATKNGSHSKRLPFSTNGSFFV